MEGLGTSWASLGVSPKLLLFLEGSHVQPCAQSGADDICPQWEAESEPVPRSVVAAVGSPCVNSAASSAGSGIHMLEGLFTRLRHGRVWWVQLMVYTAEQIHQGFSLRRIKIEEEYAKNLAKLSQNSLAAQEEG